MITKLPYEYCLKIAKKRNFVPNGKYGCSVGQLLHDLNYSTKASISKIRLKQSPVIISVNSRNIKNGKHAIVVNKGKIYDPSNKKQITMSWLIRNHNITYYNIRKDSYDFLKGC